MFNDIEIYDTTLRDGAQAEGVNFSPETKVRVAQRLDSFGVGYIEGGYPGSNPTDEQFFALAKEVTFVNAILVAFGSTHNPKLLPENDLALQRLVEAGTSVVTIFGKTWDFHVSHALGVSLERNLEIIRDTILYLKRAGKTVFFDAEHFFDGFKKNAEYALECLRTAKEAGAERIILCDTNGGCLPSEVYKIVKVVKKDISGLLGMHAHNDSGCAVANTFEAVRAGAIQVQGTINGIGERTGNADLCQIMPSLALKMKKICAGAQNLVDLKNLSGFVYEIANMGRPKNQPYVGDSSFAHKGGMHVSAVLKAPTLYEHISPEEVGNARRILVSDQSGGSNIIAKAQELGLSLEKGSDEAKVILREVKYYESLGYHFEVAEASLHILMLKALGRYGSSFSPEWFKTMVFESFDEKSHPIIEASVRLNVGGAVVHTADIGDGPVNALDNALRKALKEKFSDLGHVTLRDYKVIVLPNGHSGTASKVRVLIELSDGASVWSTVGVDEDIIKASWIALVDGLEYFLQVVAKK